MESLDIQVRNVNDGESLSYPLVLLEGVVYNYVSLDFTSTQYHMQCNTNTSEVYLEWPIVQSNGYFKAFVLLKMVGSHCITLRVYDSIAERSIVEKYMILTYTPNPTKYIMRFYYQKCCDSTDADGYDAPEGHDNSDTAAINRIRFNALLLQLAMAELFHDAGYPRYTFKMEMEDDGLPLVRPLYTSFTNATAHSISDHELYSLILKDIEASGMDTHEEYDLKHAVILGCSKYNCVTKKPQGHTALGGGKMGIFGSCGLHTWPEHLEGLMSCCLNTTKVDTNKLFDDSCYRKTYWANFATGFGAFLHELGHTLGLSHSTTGIMARGFDNMNRLFSVYEADIHSSNLKVVNGRGGAHWNSASAAQLKHSAWLCGIETASHAPPVVSCGGQTQYGPAGNGTHQKVTPFGLDFSLYQNGRELGAVIVIANKYVETIKEISKADLLTLSEDNDEWKREFGTKHIFQLLEGEYITRIDVRAVAWIDGMQIHTNLRSSRWYGSFGGKLHSLQPDSSMKVVGFFGKQGERFLGSLGIYCQPLSSSFPKPEVVQIVKFNDDIWPFEAAGKGISDGEQRPFEYQLNSIKAIIVTCNANYITKFEVMSNENNTNASHTQSPEVYSPNSHVFELQTGEYLTGIQIRSGFWIDAIQFKTNFRLSTWIGGKGGAQSTIMECPHGSYITGFYGSHGNHFLGRIGAYYQNINPDAKLCDNKNLVQNKGFHSSVNPSNTNSDVLSLFYNQNLHSHFDEPREPPYKVQGIIVVEAYDKKGIHHVESFSTIEAYHALEPMILPYQGKKYVVLFDEAELVQINANFSPVDKKSSEAGYLQGICFHSTKGCTSWFGMTSDSNLRVFRPQESSRISSIKSVHPHNTLVKDLAITIIDAVAVVELERNLLSKEIVSSSKHPELQIEKLASQHICVMSTTKGIGIESILLRTHNQREAVDAHAWRWDKIQGNVKSALPCTWYMPLILLKYRRDMAAKDANKTMKKDVIVGGIDCKGSGSYTSILIPE